MKRDKVIMKQWLIIVSRMLLAKDSPGLQIVKEKEQVACTTLMDKQKLHMLLMGTRLVPMISGKKFELSRRFDIT